MATDNPLVISPKIEVDAAPASDPAIARIVQSFVRLYEERRREAVSALRQLPSMIEMFDQLHSGTTYHMVIPPELRKVIAVGRAVLDQYADGSVGPRIRDNATGQILGQVKLEEVTPDLMSTLNQLAIQRSLAEVVQALEAIDEKVTSVLEGQRSDRLAIIESGTQLYEQAIAAVSPETRHRLLIEVVHQLGEGRQQLIRSMVLDVQALERNVPRNSLDLFLRSMTKNVPEAIKAHAKPMQESLQAVLRGSYVLAAAYQALGEPESLQVSLQPLRQALIEIGTRGARFARWLPYDVTLPPEDLWHDRLLAAASRIETTGQELDHLAGMTLELAIEAHELRGDEDDVKSSV